MGGAVSTGEDNDDLIDKLCIGGYIRTEIVERVFRAVDRGEYILPEFRECAYKDQAWRNHHLHMSAPCIYSEVLEGLQLEPGVSFLNLGSGTGYLSTMAGLIIGSSGLNHGVEFHDDVIKYANAKLEQFKKYSGAIDEFDFCEPKFMQGNCLCLSNSRRYDRIYVGAACPNPYEKFLQNLLKVGGILVVPCNDQLLQISRVSENHWKAESLLSVSFATLILPKEDCHETFEPMEINPSSLQSMCRSMVRNILRENIDKEMPNLKKRKTRIQKKSKESVKECQNNCENEDLCDCYISDDNEFLRIADESDDNNAGISNQNQSQNDLLRIFDGVINYGTESSADEEDEAEVDQIFSKNFRKTATRAGCKFRRIDKTVHNNSNSSSSNDSESDETDDTDVAGFEPQDMYSSRIVESPYTQEMSNKIKALPLPPILKDYLNFYRI